MKVLSASLQFKDNARTRTFSNIPTYCTKMSGFVQCVYFNAEFMVIAKVFYQGKFDFLNTSFPFFISKDEEENPKNSNVPKEPISINL